MKKISNRELEILRFVAKGLTDKEIAMVLNIARGTVINIRKKLYKKLEVHNGAEAVNEGYQLGLLKVE